MPSRWNFDAAGMLQLQQLLAEALGFGNRKSMFAQMPRPELQRRHRNR
jgi:hypothetical protein